MFGLLLAVGCTMLTGCKKKIGMTTVRIYYGNNSAKDKTYIDAAYKGINAFIDALVASGEDALH